jgi:hypothetical protein
MLKPQDTPRAVLITDGLAYGLVDFGKLLFAQPNLCPTERTQD